MSRQKARGSSYVDSVQYEEPNSSQVSSIYYEQPEVEEDSETEQDVYDYTSPAPVEYEVPDNASDTAPEVPERGPHIITKPPAHPPPILHQSDDSDDEEEEGQNYDNHTSASRKVYTMLTHVHMPLIYSTPSHSMEFRANTAINNSSLDIVNLDSAPSSSSPAPPPPPPSHMDNGPHFLPDSRGAKSPVSHRRSRAKAAIMVFLLAAVVIGIVSLIVSVVAVFVTGDTGSTSDSAEALTVESLQEEVQLLQSEVEQMRNRTTGSVNISSFYENCETESKIERCTPEEGLGIEFSCITDELTLDKEDFMTLDRTCYMIGAQNFPATVTLRSRDNGHCLYCECHVGEGNLVTSEPVEPSGGGSSTIQCVMDMLRCPLDQALSVTLNV